MLLDLIETSVMRSWPVSESIKTLVLREGRLLRFLSVGVDAENDDDDADAEDAEDDDADAEDDEDDDPDGNAVTAGSAAGSAASNLGGRLCHLLAA